MKLVLDTDVVVAAMRSPSGASARILELALGGKVQLLANVAMTMEYESVLKRAEHGLAAELTGDQVEQFIHNVIALCEPVVTYFTWRPQLRDAADELVLEAAINGQADALVSFNHKHFTMGVKNFGIPLVYPKDILEKLKLKHKF